MLTQLATAPAPSAKHLPPRPERFHQNQVTLTGTLQSVWQRYRPGARATTPPDILARLIIHDRDAIANDQLSTLSTPLKRKRPAHAVTLCFPQGCAAGHVPISLTANIRVQVSGYLRDDPYEQSLSEVLGQMRLPNRRLAGDEAHLIRRISTHVIVQTLGYLNAPLMPDEYDQNDAVLSGVVQRVWERPGRRPLGWQPGAAEPAPDVLARLAFYDRLAETIDPAAQTDWRRDPQGQLPMHRAHYATLRIPNGLTHEGMPVGLQPNILVRLMAYLHDVSYAESLHQILTRLRLTDRLRENDGEYRTQQVSTYVIPRSLVRFGSVPYSQVNA